MAPLSKRLNRKYYLQTDVVFLARDLLGKILCTRQNGILTSGIITETEAYAGEIDKASHAFGGRFTERTKIMYQQGGTAYVYLCYGIHQLFNVVTNDHGTPHAILIRGIKPLDGLAEIEKRRGKAIDKKTGIGPGNVSKCLGIGKMHNGADLTSSEEIWIEDRKIRVPEAEVQVGPRIGVDYAGDHAAWPYRFVWNALSQRLA